MYEQYDKKMYSKSLEKSVEENRQQKKLIKLKKGICPIFDGIIRFLESC